MENLLILHQTIKSPFSGAFFYFIRRITSAAFCCIRKAPFRVPFLREYIKEGGENDFFNCTKKTARRSSWLQLMSKTA